MQPLGCIITITDPIIYKKAIRKISTSKNFEHVFQNEARGKKQKSSPKELWELKE